MRNNLDFYKWIVVFVVYCDGLLFIGNCDKLFKFKDKLFYFWGWCIFDVVLEELCWWNIDKVIEIILSGLLVGVMFVIVYVDYIWRWFWCEMKVFFCVFVDVGFFIDVLLLNGSEIIWFVFC